MPVHITPTSQKQKTHGKSHQTRLPRETPQKDFKTQTILPPAFILSVLTAGSSYCLIFLKCNSLVFKMLQRVPFTNRTERAVKTRLSKKGRKYHGRDSSKVKKGEEKSAMKQTHFILKKTLQPNFLKKIIPNLLGKAVLVPIFPTPVNTRWLLVPDPGRARSNTQRNSHRAGGYT